LAGVLPLGPVTTGALLWRSGNELQLTLMVQARFRLEHEQPMRVLEPTPLVLRDRHQGDDATRSLVEAADVVPFRPRTDVWLTGHAFAPGGIATSAMSVRLAMYRSGAAILDKVVNVFGDRMDTSASPAPFTRMPLTYERAYGGAGFDANPVGCGGGGNAGVPNLVHPLRPTEPAAYGPVSRYWKARRQYVSSEHRRDLDRPLPVVPAGFQWSYFQAAPLDQQVDGIFGDEWVVLDGVDPALPRIQSYFPSVRGVGRLLGGNGSYGELLALAADTVAIRADEREVALTWRGMLRVASREELGSLRLAAGVELGADTTDWVEIDRRLAHEPPVLASLPAYVVGALELSPRGLAGAAGQVDLGRTDVDGFGANPHGSALGRTAVDAVAEPTMRSRTVGAGGSSWEQDLHGETLKNVDMAALRSAVAVGNTLLSAGDGGLSGEEGPGYDDLGDATHVGDASDTLTMDALVVGRLEASDED